MPSATEKQRRKELAQQAKAVESTSLLASLPVSLKQLEALFDYLDNKLSEEGCNDTLQHTEHFAAEAQVPYEALKDWLATQGGYCDCEVLANVEEKVEGLT